MKRICAIVSILACAIVFASPASAAIVPCTTNCSICDLLKLIQNIINFFLSVSVPLATAMILAGGILILTAGDSQKRLEWGKTVLTNAIVGFAIVLAGWLFINTILLWLINPEWSSRILPWNEIQCQSSSPTQTTTQPQQQGWPSEQRFVEQYQQSQQQQIQPQEPVQITEPRLRNAQWAQNEVSSGEVATLRFQVETVQVAGPGSFRHFSQKAFIGDIFGEISNTIGGTLNKVLSFVDPFGVMFSTPKPTPKTTVLPKITPKIPTSTPYAVTPKPITTATPTIPPPRKKQPDTFFVTFDIFNAKSNEKIDSIDAMFFLTDLMASTDQMFQWKTSNLPADSKVKSQVTIKDNYNNNYGYYWSNEMTVNPSAAAAQECVKIAGNNDSRRIVLMPLDGPNSYTGAQRCSKTWTTQDFSDKTWMNEAIKYKNSLNLYPFTPDNFSLWYYTGKAVTDLDRKCNASVRVYIARCSEPEFTSVAMMSQRFIVMESNVPSYFYDFIHELAHDVGLLADEYPSRGWEPLYERNCVKSYPDWWITDLGVQPIVGCSGWDGATRFRDHPNDIMRTHAAIFGKVDLYYLERAIFEE